jgi:hypothetical protein
MTDFERGIKRVCEVYQMGILGHMIPLKDRDSKDIWTAGYVDAANELDTIQDISPAVAMYVHSYTDPLEIANRACRLAAKAHK